MFFFKKRLGKYVSAQSLTCSAHSFQDIYVIKTVNGDFLWVENLFKQDCESNGWIWKIVLETWKIAGKQIFRTFLSKKIISDEFNAHFKVIAKIHCTFLLGWRRQTNVNDRQT